MRKLKCEHPYKNHKWCDGDREIVCVRCRLPLSEFRAAELKRNAVYQAKLRNARKKRKANAIRHGEH